MMYIHAMNIKTFDLNLLRVLDALLSEQSVTRAAERLHLSQPAVSNALSRLRAQTGDALLVRGAGGLLPTPRAAAMAEAIREILEQIENTLTPAAFDPRTHVQTFKLMMTDYIELLLLPDLIAALSQQAPLIKLSVQSLSPSLAGQGLLDGSLDIAFGYLGNLAEHLYRQPLVTEHFVCVARKDHPRIQGALDMAQFLSESHVLVSPQGGGFSGLVDDLLVEQGLERKVVLSIPHFTIAPSIVMNTDYLITLPNRTAQHFAQLYPIQIIEPPLEIPVYSINQAWHARTQNAPANQWLRALLHTLANRLAT